MTQHIPVLLNEIIENLDIAAEGTYVDLTLGGGGHAGEIWNKLTAGTLIVFDIDAEAIALFKQKIVSQAAKWQEVSSSPLVEMAQVDQKKVYIAHTNFAQISNVMRAIGIEKVNGVIADLGWSADQLNRVPGLSYENDSLLDMRMDSTLGVKASDLLNALYKPELLRLFLEFADIKGKQAIGLVDSIIKFRQQRPIQTTGDLWEIINKTNRALPSATIRGSRTSRDHEGSLPARVFQALRIAVNNELSTLQSVLPQAWDLLTAGGTLQVITFHSGEDRLVSKFFAAQVAEGKASQLFPAEALYPTVEELKQNLRSRSARLRGIKKL